VAVWTVGDKVSSKMDSVLEKKRRLNCRKQRLSSVARCFLFKPKLPIWVNFGGPEIGNLDIFYIHLEYFTGIWEIL
jgi:hypothetical protein